MNKQLYNGIKEQFAKLRVVVIGDVMVDEYVTGDVSRISPEAPIPILNYKKMTRIAGGASNVAHNVAALGAKVSMLGVIGDDDGGTWICQHLDDRQINARGMVVEKIDLQPSKEDLQPKVNNYYEWTWNRQILLFKSQKKKF